MYVTEDDDRDRPAGGELDVIELDFVARDTSVAGWLRLEVRPRLGVTRFLAAVLVADEDPVVVVDFELPAPRTAFEFRAPGVWTEFCCETPLDHWTVGLEAFGLRVDPAQIVTPETFGERVPVGLDLDLDTVGAPDGDASAFTIDVRVHGEVLVADRAWDLDATGTRTRRTAPPGVTHGVRHLSHLGAPGPPPIGELTVGWPDAGTIRPQRRGWVGGNRPGWVDLPVHSAE